MKGLDIVNVEANDDDGAVCIGKDPKSGMKPDKRFMDMISRIQNSEVKLISIDSNTLSVTTVDDVLVTLLVGPLISSVLILIVYPHESEIFLQLYM